MNPDAPESDPAHARGIARGICGGRRDPQRRLRAFGDRGREPYARASRLAGAGAPRNMFRMVGPLHSRGHPQPRPDAALEIARLATLGPEVQGDVDVTLLRANLDLSPLERLVAASQAATQIEQLQRAMKAAAHG